MEDQWQSKTCGHAWCRMCNGHVHPGTRVVLKGPTDVVKCNRRWHKLYEYQYLFRENCAGSARLTVAMKEALGAKRVAPPEDLPYSPARDILNDKVYERKKKEAKDRVCFANHYAPRCATFTYAQAQYQQRSMDAPYGDPSKEVLRDSVITDSKLAVQIAALCRIHHAVGDAFAIEHVFPAPMLQFQSYQELLNMPGVFVFT